jgi:hypothetical protein
VKPALFHNLHAHHQIVIEKFSGVIAVCPNAANYSRKMDYNIRVGICVQAFYVFRINQIVIPASRDENIAAPVLLKFPDNIIAEETRPASYRNPFIFKVRRALSPHYGFYNR